MSAARQNQSDELRILHWDIHSWRDDADASNLEAVVKLVRATDPHVVSLVEVDESWGRPSELDEVANRCDYAAIFVPAFEFGQNAPAGGFGNAPPEQAADSRRPATTAHVAAKALRRE